MTVLFDINVFCTRLKMLRVTTATSRADLSNATGIPISSLGNYERGDKTPTIETLMKICEYYKVSADYLLGITEEKSGRSSWPVAVPTDATQSVNDIKSFVEEMILSARTYPYGLQTLDAYSTIISLLPSIDSFAAGLISELRESYPSFKCLGAETDMLFDGQPLLLALVAGSKNATAFVRRLTAITSQISDRTLEVSGHIEKILEIQVLGAIKGQPLEIIERANPELLHKSMPQASDKNLVDFIQGRLDAREAIDSGSIDNIDDEEESLK